MQQQSSKVHVIFDFDGVIVDSTGIAFEVFSYIIDKYFSGYNFDKKILFAKVSALDLKSIIEYLTDKSSTKINSAQKALILEDFNNQWSSNYRHIKINKELEKTILFLKAFGCKISIASSATKEHITSILHSAEQDFNCLYDCNSSPYSKTDKKFWQNLIEQDAKEYVHFLIEDNESNIKAAREAGIYPILYNFQLPMMSSITSSFIEHNIICSYTRASSFEFEKEEIVISKDDSENVAQKWNKHIKDNPHAFDGPLSFCSNLLIKNGSLYIKGNELSYKFRSLAPFTIFSLAIQCYLSKKGKYLLGLRNGSTGMESNYYEFIPSGGIESFSKQSAIEQIKKEMLEEAYIKFDSHNMNIVFKGYIIDIKNKLIDLVHEVIVENDILPICASNEHKHIEWADISFIKNNKENLTTSSKIIFNEVIDTE